MPFLQLVSAVPNAIADTSKLVATGDFFLYGTPASILLIIVVGIAFPQRFEFLRDMYAVADMKLATAFSGKNAYPSKRQYVKNIVFFAARHKKAILLANSPPSACCANRKPHTLAVEEGCKN